MRVSVNKNKFAYYFLGFTIVFLQLYGSVEINYVYYFLSICLFWTPKVSSRVIKILMPLFLLVVIGVFSAIFNKPDLYGFVRDFVFLTKPILAIFLGYLVVGKMGDVKKWLELVIFCGFLFAILHLVKFSIVVVHTGFDLHAIRENLDLDSNLEVFAFLILLWFRYNNKTVVTTKKDQLILVLIGVSILTYLSRSMIIMTLLLSYFTVTGFSFRYKQLRWMLLLGVLSVLFYAYLYTLNLSISSRGIDSFLYKIRMAPSEIFYIQNKDASLRYLYDHWRGFEAHMAFSGLKGIDWLFGQGLGAKVDLGKPFLLGSEYFRFIPILHNGYVYVILKSGILGLVLYLYFLYNSIIILTRNNKKYLIQLLIPIAIITFWIFSSFVVTGLFNQGEFISFIFGGFIGLIGIDDCRKESFLSP